MSELEKLDENMPYLVINFPNDILEDDKMSVEIISRNWAVLQNKQWYCMYPRPKDYDKMDRFLQINRTPDKNWEKHPIQIISQCVDIQQAKRHLVRAFNSKDVKTDDTDKKTCKPLSQSAASKVLNEIPKFPSQRKMYFSQESQKVASECESSLNDIFQDFKGKSQNSEKYIKKRSSTSLNETVQSTVNQQNSPRDIINSFSANSAKKKVSVLMSTSNDDDSFQKIYNISDKVKKLTKKRLFNDAQDSEEDTINTCFGTPVKSSTPKKKDQEISPKTSSNDFQNVKGTKRKIDINSSQEIARENKKKKKKTEVKDGPTMEDVNEMIKDCSSYKDLALIQKTLTLIQMKEFSAQFKTIKRNLQYDAKQKYDNIMAKVVEAMPVANVKCLTKIKQNFDVKLPMDNLDTFVKFDRKIGEDDNFKQNFMDYLDIKVKMYSSLNESIGKILGELISKSIQICYSGCGKRQKNVEKLNFSKTTVYSLFESVLIVKFDVADKEVRSKVSRWLAGASDREGGKIKRMKQELNNDSEH